jgi:hypothetical protein
MRPARAARWCVVAAMLMAVVAMGVVLGRPAGATADLAKLPSLRADLQAAAATGQSLYQRTGRLLVQLAEAELADPTVRSNAIAAIRTVTRSSSRLAERSLRLAEALEPLPVGIPGSAEQLNEALSSYHAAKRDLVFSVDELQGRIAATETTGARMSLRLSFMHSRARPRPMARPQTRLTRFWATSKTLSWGDLDYPVGSD